MTKEPANPKKSIKEFYVWKIGMHLFLKLKTDCKDRVRVGKFPAHQIKNKSSIHIKKKNFCGQVTFFVLKFLYVSWGENFTCDS